MPEYNMARRNLEGLQRQRSESSSLFSMKISPWPWPFQSAYVFSFDCEGDFGGGKDSRGETEIVPRLAEFYGKLGVAGTFFFVGKLARQVPSVIQILVEHNQDIAGHGYLHRNIDGLSIEEQSKEFSTALEALKTAGAENITGWRCPYGTYDEETYVAMEKAELVWSSSWGRSLWGSLPFRPVVGNYASNIVEIPYDDSHFDAFLYNKLNLSPKQAYSLWLNHAKSARQNNGLYVLLAHPFQLNEDESRVEILKDLADTILSEKNIWVGSLSQIAKRKDCVDQIAVSLNCEMVNHHIQVEYDITNASEVGSENLCFAIDTGSSISWVEAPHQYLVDTNNRGRRAFVRISEIESQGRLSGALKIKTE